MMEQRRRVQGGLQGVADSRLNVQGNGRFKDTLEEFSGVLRRSGGLHRRRRLLGGSVGGAAEPLLIVNSTLGHLTGDSQRRRQGESIA